MSKLDRLFEDMINCNDIFSYMDEIEDELNNLPITRESAIELMNLIDTYELKEIYDILFQNYADVLTMNERQYVNEKYRRTFVIPCELFEEKTGPDFSANISRD